MSRPESTASDLGPRWYAAKTQPRKEALAAFHLARQDFACFSPKIMTARAQPRPGRRPTLPTLAPLFPGYIFVRLDLDRDQWRSVNGTVGVSNLVHFGERPAHFPEGLVEELKSNANDNGLLRFNDDFSLGDNVRLTGGAFDGWIGKVLRTESNGRVAVLLEFMSRELPVVVKRSMMLRVVQ